MSHADHPVNVGLCVHVILYILVMGKNNTYERLRTMRRRL